MTLAARLEQLEPRERRLLNLLVVVFAAAIVIALPIGVRSLFLAGSEHNERMREAIEGIRSQRSVISQREANVAVIESRYARPAPELAGFLEGLAKRQNLDIPESQDRPAVPHGKQYEERSNRIVLRRVGLLDFSRFLEGIAQSGHPVTVSELNVRKRAPDAYDVTMVVNAFDRKERAKAGSATAKDESSGEETEAP